MKPEQKAKTAFRALVQNVSRGIILFNVQQTQFSTGGVSDYQLILPPNGMNCSVEIKAPGNTLSVRQARFLESVNANGGLGICLYPVDYPEFKTYLKEYMNGYDVQGLRTYARSNFAQYSVPILEKRSVGIESEAAETEV